MRNEHWCDRCWTYRFNYEPIEEEKYKGDYGHFIALIDPPRRDYEHPDVQVFPYLVINVCYCIHDYRRMGIVCQNGVEIPPFSSLLRTVIVDLHHLKERLDNQRINVSSDHFYLKVLRIPEKPLPDEEPHNYLARIANKAYLRIESCGHSIDHQDVIFSFDEFFQRVDWVELLNIVQPACA